MDYYPASAFLNDIDRTLTGYVEARQSMPWELCATQARLIRSAAAALRLSAEVPGEDAPRISAGLLRTTAVAVNLAATLMGMGYPVDAAMLRLACMRMFAAAADLEDLRKEMERMA